jgi:cation:H+ antiporter
MFDVILQWGFAGPALFIAVGMAVLVGGGEILIRGAVRVAEALKIPSIIIGLTIVAFGTSAPELAVSLSAALKGSADLAVGNVVGSNICNIGLILGLAALMSPMNVSPTLIRREIPLMIFLMVLMYLFAITGTQQPLSLLFSEQYGQYEGLYYPWSGGVLVGILFAYMCWTIYELRRGKKSDDVDNDNPSEYKSGGWKQMFVSVLMIIIGIILLVVGSDLMVQGSVQIARLMGVSELVIGLTILAVGTSLPELVVSVMAAFHGKSDIAIGNVVGSNIFNILGVLGVTAMFSGGAAAGGLQVSAAALLFDMPMMFIISLFCFVICLTNRQVRRREGFVLLFFYGVYLTALCIMSGL